MSEVDARGLSCPQPVMLTLEALEAAEDGQEVVVVVDNATARENVIRAGASRGWRAVAVDVELSTAGEIYRIRLGRSG